MPFTFEEKGKSIFVKASAKKQTELFIETARALFGFLYDIDHIRGRERIKIVVDASSMHELLYAWLQELLVRNSLHKMAFGEFSVASIQKINDSQYLLTGAAYGEYDDPPTHAPLRKIKEVRGDACQCEEQGEQSSCEYEIVLE